MDANSTQFTGFLWNSIEPTQKFGHQCIGFERLRGQQN
jgi:hypothetical protein